MKITTFFTTALLIACIGCGSDPAPGNPAPDGGGGGGDVDLGGGGGGPIDCARTCSNGQVCSPSGLCVFESSGSLVYVLGNVTIPRPSEDGVVSGFNMDGLNSTESDLGGCEVQDFTSPSGVLGVDNRAASLVDMAEAAILPFLDGRPIEDVLSDILTNGEYFFGIVVTPVGSGFSVYVAALSPAGAPLAPGTVIQPGQEFEILGVLSETRPGLSLADSSGVAEFRLADFVLTVPQLSVFPIMIPEGLGITVEDIVLRLNISTRTPTAEVGVAVRVSAIEDVIVELETIPEFQDLPFGDISNLAGQFLLPDLKLDGPDGLCNGLSAGVSVSVVEGNLVEQ